MIKFTKYGEIFANGVRELGFGSIQDLRDYFSQKYIKSDHPIYEFNRFFSGKIYSFLYEDSHTDIRPIFLSLYNRINAGELYEIGINLNDLDPKDKTILLTGIVSMFSEKIDDETFELPFYDKNFLMKFFNTIELHPRIIKLDKRLINGNSIIEIEFNDWGHLIYYNTISLMNR